MQFIHKLIVEGGGLMILILVLGGLATIGSIVGLIVSLAKKSRGAHLISSLAGIGAALVTLSTGWLGYSKNKALIQSAVESSAPESRMALLMKGNAEISWNVTLSLWLSVLPLMIGTFLLVRGLMLKPANESKPRGPDLQGPVPVLVACLCTVLGLGLLLAALASYLEYDNFFTSFLML